MRYLGRQYGYYPSDIDEAYEVDSIQDAMVDVSIQFSRIAWERDQETKLKLREDLFNGLLSKLISVLNKRLEKNADKGKFLCGEKLTTADFQCAAMIFSKVYNEAGSDWNEQLQPVFEKHEYLLRYSQTMREVLAKYLEKDLRGCFDLIIYGYVKNNIISSFNRVYALRTSVFKC